MKVLVTGFGPFPGVPRNPSQLVVESLPDAMDGAEIHRQVLPTEYRGAGSILESLLTAQRPDILLCTGVGNASVFKLETLARNRVDAQVADQAGWTLVGPIESEGPDTLPSTLPFAELAPAMTAAGLEVALSDDAGGYVCNHTFYRALLAIRRQRLMTRCGFLHLPALRAEPSEAVQVAQGHAAVMLLVRSMLSQSAAVGVSEPD